MAVRPIISVSVCSGVDSLELGLSLGAEYLQLGDVRAVLRCEREAYAVSNLAAHIEAGLLLAAPVWSDITTLGGPEVSDYLREAVEGRIGLVFGGIPCQGWSVAGEQKGIEDERDLWPALAEFVKAHHPKGVFIENVSGFAVRDGVGRVASELHEMGYDVAAIMLRASDIGASHGRQRFFLLAVADPDDLGHERGARDGREAQRWPEHGSHALDNSTGPRRNGAGIGS